MSHCNGRRIRGGNTSQYWFEEDGNNMNSAQANKPSYRVSSMDEINAIPWNGFKVASTFSGCGGSCLGYRMAGFKVVWANEFVPIAQESYKANALADCYLDPRDIKAIKPQEVLDCLGMQVGELDLFDGSPPCQAFSTAGKREKGWGQNKTYEHGASQCNETLFDEYIRLLRGLMPKVFVAENVSGLIKGTAKGYFLQILKDLKASGYQVKCKVLDAQWLGVPQMRQRTIFIGVRNDLGMQPEHPKPLGYRYSVRDALPWILNDVQDPKGQFGIQHNDGSLPLFSVKAGSASHIKIEVGSGALVKDFHESGGFRKIDASDMPMPSITATQCRVSVEHETSIKNFAIGNEWDNLKPGEKSSKYLNLVRQDADKPSGAICAAHGNLSTAGVTHPTEKRKFTIQELKRICAFPDDFILKGSYAQQWERLGNSVPPLMMKAIAEVIRDEILQKIDIQNASKQKT